MEVEPTNHSMESYSLEGKKLIWNHSYKREKARVLELV